MANKIVEFKSNRGRAASKPHPHLRGAKARAEFKPAHPELKPGTTCFAVQDDASKLFYIGSYVNSAQAQSVAEKVSPGDDADIKFNWRQNIQDTVPSDQNPESQ